MASSVGETKLTALLASMQPLLQPEVYVFLTFPPSACPPVTLPATLTFTEAEGTTVITTRAAAVAHGLADASHFPSHMITLQVHSSLNAVGFLATISRALAQREGMAVNVVSAFFHDHLFVPEAMAEGAMEVLQGLVEEAKAKVNVDKTP